VRLKGAQANIPFLIRALHPGINQRDYEYFQKDFVFNKRNAYVCEDCYLFISLSSNCSGQNMNIGNKKSFVG
jgi:hypothetical protein